MAESNATPPYRAEHVGSLPRPEQLLKAREAWRAGTLAKEALTRIEDECIRDAVAMQERVGIGAMTDGEFRKTGWREFLYEKCDGFASTPDTPMFPFKMFDGGTFEGHGEPRCIGKIRRREPLAHFNGDAVFDKTAYPDRKSYFSALTAVMREEIFDLAHRGCTYLQMDEVPIAVLCDPKNQARVRQRGEDPDELIDTYIEAINDSIGLRSAGMTVAVHMCRGNIGHGMADGGYEPVADRLFNQLDVDGFFLEYDTPRAGDFQPLRFLPKGKRVVLGLVSTKLPEIESADSLKRRIDEAAKYAPLDQLCLSPQCGFSSVARTGRLSPDTVERKLARIVEVAAAVWGV
jgi:5-methyltetrahydropteroyltriglutamate--homocysteine methyltransferase